MNNTTDLPVLVIWSKIKHALNSMLSHCVHYIFIQMQHYLCISELRLKYATMNFSFRVLITATSTSLSTRFHLSKLSLYQAKNV